MHGKDSRVRRMDGSILHWTKVCGCVILAVIGLMAIKRVLASEDERRTVIRLERLELVNKDGECIGEFGTVDGKYPFLELRCKGDRQEGGSIRLAIPYGGGPVCSLRDSAGVERAKLYLGAKLENSESESGKVRVVSGQIPHLLLMDEGSHIRGSFGSNWDGSVILEMRGPDREVVHRVPK